MEVCSIVLVEEVGGAAVAEELAGRSWLERRPPPDGRNQTPCLRFGLSQTKRGDLGMLKGDKKARGNPDLNKRGPRGQCLEPKEQLVHRNGRVCNPRRVTYGTPWLPPPRGLQEHIG